MLRPTNFRDVSVQQGTEPSRPTQFTDESSVTFHQDTQVFNISDEMGTTAAPADPATDEQDARAKSLADYAKAQTEIRAKQMIAGVTQDAASALLQQEQRFTQQRAQDHAQAAAEIQQIKHRAQGFINGAQGAIYEVQGARQKETQERYDES